MTKPITHEAQKTMAEKRTGRIVSLQEMAELAGCSIGTLRRYMKAGMPVAEKGKPGRGGQAKMDTAKVITWMIYRDGDKADAAAGEMSWKNRRTKAQAQMLELNVLERRGQLLHADAICFWLAEAIGNTRNGLLGMPADLASRLAIKESSAEIQEELNEAITQHLKGLSNVPGGLGLYRKSLEEGVGAADKDDRQ